MSANVHIASHRAAGAPSPSAPATARTSARATGSFTSFADLTQAVAAETDAESAPAGQGFLLARTALREGAPAERAGLAASAPEIGTPGTVRAGSNVIEKRAPGTVKALLLIPPQPATAATSSAATATPAGQSIPPAQAAASAAIVTPVVDGPAAGIIRPAILQDGAQDTRDETKLVKRKHGEDGTGEAPAMSTAVPAAALTPPFGIVPTAAQAVTPRPSARTGDAVVADGSAAQNQDIRAAPSQAAFIEPPAVAVKSSKAGAAPADMGAGAPAASLTAAFPVAAARQVVPAGTAASLAATTSPGREAAIPLQAGARSSTVPTGGSTLPAALRKSDASVEVPTTSVPTRTFGSVEATATVIAPERTLPAASPSSPAPADPGLAAVVSVRPGLVAGAGPKPVGSTASRSAKVAPIIDTPAQNAAGSGARVAPRSGDSAQSPVPAKDGAQDLPQDVGPDAIQDASQASLTATGVAPERASAAPSRIATPSTPATSLIPDGLAPATPTPAQPTAARQTSITTGAIPATSGTVRAATAGSDPVDAARSRPDSEGADGSSAPGGPALPTSAVAAEAALTSIASGGPTAADAPQAASAANLPVIDNVSIGNVPIEIGLKSLAGVSRFEIRLAPNDLGRVDVKLDIDGEGRVKARLEVERPETLAFLQRDGSQLQQALEQAGLKAQDGSVTFTLRDPAGQNGLGQSALGQNAPGQNAPSQNAPNPAASAHGSSQGFSQGNAQRDPGGQRQDGQPGNRAPAAHGWVSDRPIMAQDGTTRRILARAGLDLHI